MGGLKRYWQDIDNASMLNFSNVNFSSKFITFKKKTFTEPREKNPCFSPKISFYLTQRKKKSLLFSAGPKISFYPTLWKKKSLLFMKTMHISPFLVAEVQTAISCPGRSLGAVLSVLSDNYIWCIVWSACCHYIQVPGDE